MLRTLVLSRAARRFALLVVLIAVTAAVALLRMRGDMLLTPDGVRDAIRAWGALAPVAFAGAFILRPFVFFPSTLLFVTGGLAFGVFWGTVYAAIGGTAGAVVGFVLARVLGQEFVRAHLGDRFPQFRDARWGLGLVFLLNVIPVVPITAINYGAGLSGMGLLPFTMEVFAGLTPRACAYSFFGNSLLQTRSPDMLMALGLLAALVVVPICVRRRYLTGREVRESLPGAGSVPTPHM